MESECFAFEMRQLSVVLEVSGGDKSTQDGLSEGFGLIQVIIPGRK